MQWRNVSHRICAVILCASRLCQYGVRDRLNDVRREISPQLDIAGNDLRYSSRRSSHGRYDSLLHSAFLDDGIACRDWLVLYDLLRAVRCWYRAQPPEGTHIFRHEKLCGPLSETMRICEQHRFLHDTYMRFLMASLEVQGHLNPIRGRQPDAEHMTER